MSNEELREHITEETLHAWLDHELGRRESASITEHVERCATCGALLDDCREMRSTVSHLLNSFDAEMSSTPRATSRPRLVSNSRAPSAPIISHIVAFHQPVAFWPTARRMVSLAALAMIFVGTASTFMVRSYHSVAGSFGTVAKRHPTGSNRKELVSGTNRANRTSDHRVNLTGMVTTTSGQAIRGAQVSIRGTDLNTVTDFTGHFWFRGVPQSVTTLDAKGPPGFATRVQYVNLYDSAEPVVNIVLLARVVTVRPFVVSSAMSDPTFAAPSQSCLTAFEPYTSRDPRMFQALRGTMVTAGDFRLDIVDWPAVGKNTSALFTFESPGTLVGRVQQGDADIRITLTRDGAVWRGSASETRNYKPRWRRVSMREASCAL